MELTIEDILKTHGENPKKILSLEASKLKVRKICSLSMFSKLKSINIASNFIESLESCQIDRLESLKELDVSSNSLRKLPNIPQGVVKLNVAFNKLNSLEYLPRTLQMLKAQGNLLTSTNFLSNLTGLVSLDISSNEISVLECMEKAQIEELNAGHNKIINVSQTALPVSLKSLNLRNNFLTSVDFLQKLTSLESLNLENNKLETLKDLPKLPFLTELVLANNQIFLLELSADICELLPSLFLLDLSSNILYDRAELLTLDRIESFFELNLENNPCNVSNPQNNSEKKLFSRARSLAGFDENRVKKEINDLDDLIMQKRKHCLGVLRDIEFTMEQQFYDEFGLLKGKNIEKNEIFVVHEENEDDHEDLEKQEQQWFSTQLEWTRKVTERKGAAHRYIKDDRPTSSSASSKESPSTARGVNRHRKKLEEAIKFCKG